MGAEELLAAYLRAKVAVSWCEMFLSPNEFDDRDMWADLGLKDLDQAIKFIQEAMSDEDTMRSVSGETRLLARVQTETKDFRRYVAAKMGMM